MMKYFRLALIIYKDPRRKSLLRILREMLELTVINRAIPIYYLSRFLYKKETTNYKDYLSNDDLDSLYSDKIHTESVVTILENKIAFAELCEKHGLPTPALLGYSFGNFFYRGKTASRILGSTDLMEYLNGIFDENKLNSIIAKKALSYGGGNIFKIDRDSMYQDILDLPTSFYHDSYVFQERITNHHAINKIYSHSLNTIRFDMTLDDFGAPFLLGAVIRFGVDGNFVDNRSQGGFCVNMDAEKGLLLKSGFSQMNKGGQTYTVHPNTKFIFEGFQIPYYREALELAKELTKRYPTALVGWDIAIGEDGPVIIEGNYKTNLTMTEAVYGGYKKHPRIKQLMKKAKE